MAGHLVYGGTACLVRRMEETSNKFSVSFFSPSLCLCLSSFFLSLFLSLSLSLSHCLFHNCLLPPLSFLHYSSPLPTAPPTHLSPLLIHYRLPTPTRVLPRFIQSFIHLLFLLSVRLLPTSFHLWSLLRSFSLILKHFLLSFPSYFFVCFFLLSNLPNFY